jgi:hypothetical protein
MSNAVPWSTLVRHERQPQRHVHGVAEGGELHGDQALVVVAGDHRIELALERAQEQRVRGERTADVLALVAKLGHGGREHVPLLAPEEAAFARVRVHAADRDPRARDPELGQRPAQQPRHAQQFHARDGVRNRAQRAVDRQQRHAQPAADEHHRDVGRARGLRQQLGMPRPRIAGRVERLLVQRRSHQRVHAPRERVLRRPQHRLGRGAAARGRHLPERDPLGVRHVDHARPEVLRHRELQAARMLGEHPPRPVDDGVRLGSLGGRERLQHDLGSDAGRVAERQRQPRRHRAREGV